ncbi:hypothetical protein MMPV_003421 [Pyropia vietnamensis]
MGRTRRFPPPSGRIHRGPFLFPFSQDVTWVALSPCSPPHGDRGRSLRHYSAVRGTLSNHYGGAAGLSGGDDEGDGNGDGDSEGARPTAYEVRVGDVALLRPSDNERRPYAAVVLAIHDSTTAAGSGVALDVRWLYRPEDMEGAPPVPAGEDELYESDHIDPDQDADSLVGKAIVSSYAAYQRRREAGGVGGATTGLRAAAAGVVEEGGHSGGRKDGSGADSDSTLVGDNYAAASTHYYVRYYYDSVTHRCMPSTFNDPTADLADEDDDEEGGTAHRGASSSSESKDLTARRQRRHGHGRAAGAARHPLAADDSDDEVDGHPLSAPQSRAPRGTPGMGRRPTTKRQRGNDSSSSDAAIEVVDDDDDDSTDGAMDDERRTRSRRRVRRTAAGAAATPRRGAEMDELRDFVAAATAATPAGRSLYISGVPGTGKTATVRAVLAEAVRRGPPPPPARPLRVVEVNGMALPDPAAAYSALYEAVSGVAGTPPGRAAALLHTRWPRGGGTTARGVAAMAKKKRTGAASGHASRADRDDPTVTILVIDEMDALVTRRPRVLFDLLEWPTRSAAALAIIGISNTMDLPERLLLPRLTSRLGVSRLIYMPYTSAQLTTILNAALPDVSAVHGGPPQPTEGGATATDAAVTAGHPAVVWEPTAVEMAARKVATVSGDVRRVLAIARRAVDVAVESAAIVAAADVAAAAYGVGASALAGDDDEVLVEGDAAAAHRGTTTRVTSGGGGPSLAPITVTVGHVQRAARDLTAASSTEASLSSLAPAELLAVAAVTATLRASGLPAMAARDLPAAVAALHRRTITHPIDEGSESGGGSGSGGRKGGAGWGPGPPPDAYDVAAAVARLRASRVVGVEGGGGGWGEGWVGLLVAADDVERAWRSAGGGTLVGALMGLPAGGVPA